MGTPANGPVASSTVDLLSKLIVQVGFPVVVAGVLLWFLLTKFQTNMDTITSRMANNTVVITELITQEKASYAELVKQTAELSRQTSELAKQTGELVDQTEAIKKMEGSLLRLEQQSKHSPSP